MATPKLKLGNDKWATKQRSLLAYNDEGNKFKSLPFQVERLSGGSYVGRNGLIQYAATEEPRIDFTNNTKGGLLLEPQRTNLIQRSEEFDNSYFGKYNTSITPNAVNSPNGSLNADKIVENSANNIHSLDSQFHSATGNLSASVFVKKDERKYIRFMITQLNPTIDHYAVFDLENKSVYYTSSGVIADISEFQDDWIRIKISVNSTGNLARMSIVLLTVLQSTPQTYQGDGTSGLYLWGGQLEAGDYSTSYIPTAGSTATRVQEFIENRYTGLSSASGTIFIDLDTKGLDSSYSKIIAVRDTVTGDSIRFEPFQAGSAFILGIFGLNGANVLPPFPNEATLPINNRTKIAFTFSGSSFKFSQDGNLVTGTYTGTPRQYNQIGGANITGGAMHNGIIQDFRIYDEVLTDVELQTLTTL